MIYRILGELTIEADGKRLVLPAGHRLTVLAVLLVHANKRVSTADLLRAGWGSADVDDTQLHKCVSYLRALLGTVRRRGDLLTHQRFGYELRVTEDDLDRLVFERLVRDADAAAEQRRVDDETDLLRKALALWRGPRPLSGVPDQAFRREAADLAHRRKRAAVRLFDLELGQGRYDAIIGDLQTMVDYHPTDRRLTEQLMLALYRGGHATDALAAYDRFSTVLHAETGAEPDAALRNLMYAIASADEAAVARYESASTRHMSASAWPLVVPRQLPPDLPDFVGRDDPVGEVRWLLGGSPGTGSPVVVVVVGPGGIGKTALAVHAAHHLRARYPDGQLFVDMAGTTPQPLDPGEALAQMLRAFGVANVPETKSERAAMFRSVVGDRQVLLVLDDARDEAQVRDLVPGNAGCGVLVTARQRLPGMEGAHHVPPLEPLDPATATALFLRVVRRTGIYPREEPRATQRVVELCAGLPLALCIAAALRARDSDRPTGELTERLERQRLGAFVYGGRSVERSIGAGFDRLDDEARLLFLGLGLAQLADFGLWTAAAVLAGTPADPADALLRLARCYMIEPGDRAMRYRFHDLTRDYARSRAEGDDTLAHRRLREQVYSALLTLARRAHRGIYGGDFDVVHSAVPTWAAPASVLAELDRSPLAWFNAERLNIRAAVRGSAELGLTDVCWDLAISAHEFYTLGGYHDDWYATHIMALEACQGAGNARGEAVVVTILGQPALAASRRAGIPDIDELSHAVQVFEQLGDSHGQAIALRTLANGLRRHGKLDRALELFAQALSGYEANGDLVGRWQTLRYTGQAQLELGRLDDALRTLRAAEDAAHAVGRQRLVAQSALWLGRTHLARGELAEAKANFQFVLDAVGSEDVTGRAYAMYALGDTALRDGSIAEAERFLRTAVDLARQVADGVLEGRAHMSAADMYRQRGRMADEAAALEQAATCFANSDAVYLEAQALDALGDCYAVQGDVASAQRARARARTLDARLGLGPNGQK